jgi:acetyltransferase-like isoleucine patch superfamily enzyme
VPAADPTWDAERLAALRSAGAGVLVFSGALILKPEAVSIGDGSRVDDFTRIEGGDGVEIGRHVHVSSFCSIFAGGAARLGDYACMAQGSRILTGSEQLDAAMSSVAPADWRRVVRAVSVLDHLAFLGANAVLMPGVQVGVGAVVGAGGVVTRDVPPWEVWAGVPARRLSLRDPQPLRERGIPVDELAAAPLSGR